MNRPLSLLLFICLTFFTCSFGNDVRMDRLNSQNDLFGDTLHEIFRDRSGCLWIAGVKGVAKYDGKHIFNFTEQADTLTYYLNGLQFRYIAEDAAGGIWVGSDTGIHHYDSSTNNFKQIAANVISDVRFIGNYNDSCLWVSCSRGKNYSINYLNLEIEERKEKYTVVASAIDNKGQEWLVMNGGRLFKGYNKEMLKMEHGIHDVCFGPSGGMFAGTNNGIYYWRSVPDEENYSPSGHISQESDDLKLINNQVISLAYADGFIWAGSRNGLCQLSLNDKDIPVELESHFNQPDDPFSLISNRVNDIFCDHEGITWIATHGGLSKIDPSKLWFYSFRKNPSSDNTLHDNAIFPISGNDQGDLWFGSLSSGVSRYSSNNHDFSWFNNSNSTLQRNGIGFIYTDLNQDTWISTRANLYRVTKDDFEIVKIIDENRNNIEFRSLSAIIQHSDEKYWAGVDGGILKLDRISPNVFQVDTKLDENIGFVISLFIDCYNRIWAGTSNGVFLFEGTENKLLARFDLDNQSIFRSNTVQSINADSDGSIWLGTTNGLYKADNESVFLEDPEKIRFHGYFEEDGLTSNYITAVLPAEDGVMWLSSWKGIMKFDPKSLTEFQFTSFSYSDGIISEKFNRFGAYKDTLQSIFYFGGIDGVNYFSSSVASSDIRIPSIYLNEIELDNFLFFQLSDSVLFEGEDSPIAKINEIGAIKELRVNFGSTSLLNPDKQNFAWMLEGRDTSWTYSREQDVVLRDISTGEYVLKISAVSSRGEFGQIKRVAITINSWFGKVMKVLLPILIFIGLMVFQYKRQQKNKKSEKYLHSNLTADKSEELVDRLLKLMNEQKPYLKSGLTAAELAVMLEISTVKLSQVLNESLDTKFYEFLNKYRVGEFITRLEGNEGDNLTLTGLAELCGFSSKSTFYRSFDREKGMTPAQYSKSLRNKKN